MLFTMTIPFLEVVLHTTNQVLNQRPKAICVGPDKQVDVVRVKSAEVHEEEMTETSNRVNLNLWNLLSRLFLPIFSLAFTIIFWVVGLIVSYSSGAIQDPNMTDCLTIDMN